MSFPDQIPVRIVERYLEFNIRQNSDDRCEVLFEYNKDHQNHFTIFYNAPETLILIKMYALRLIGNNLNQTEKYN